MTLDTLGVIGCGAVIDVFYGKALASMRRRGTGLRFFDTDLGRAKRAADLFGGTYAVWPTEDFRVRAAIVATPPHTHFTIVRDLLKAGVHVHCEKPLTLDERQGRELVELAKQAGLALTVNQTRRLFPSSGLARELVREGRLGQLLSAHIQEGAPFNWPTRSGFYFNPGLTRNGVLGDRGSHAFDLLHWITGESIHPTLAWGDGTSGPEASTVVRFGGNLEGSCILSWLLNLDSFLEIRGESGVIRLGPNWNYLRWSTPGESGPGRRLWAPARRKDFAAFAKDSLQEFENACLGKSTRLDAASVLPSIGFLSRAYDMIRQGWPGEDWP